MPTRRKRLLLCALAFAVEELFEDDSSEDDDDDELEQENPDDHQEQEGRDIQGTVNCEKTGEVMRSRLSPSSKISVELDVVEKGGESQGQEKTGESTTHQQRDESLNIDQKNCSERKQVSQETTGRKKRGKTSPWLRRRNEEKIFAQLMTELSHIEDPASDRNWLRMDKECFDSIVHLLTPSLKKKPTHMQEPISIQERVAITLRYLATGATLRDIAGLFAVGERTASYMVLETCAAIIDAMKHIFAFPSTTKEWINLAKDNELKWSFPHCLGAISGRHVIYQRPNPAGFQGTNCIILMAIVDANLMFRYVNVETNVKVKDSNIWSKCGLTKLLEESSERLPQPEPVEGVDTALPFAFVGDDALPLQSCLLKPYDETNLSREQNVFNERLSRVRSSAENAFGAFAARFRLLLKPINLKPEKVQMLVLAACSLHNYLRMHNSAVYSPSSLIDEEDLETGQITPGRWRQEARDSFLNLTARKYNKVPSSEAETVRNIFCNYFSSSAGGIPSQ